MKKNILIYDFDGTLTPYPVPKFPIFQKAGLSDEDFQRELIKSKILIKDSNADIYETYYKMYLDILKKANLDNESSLIYGSDNIEYNKGVVSFLDYLNGNKVENYLLSSGIKIFLQNTKISAYFQEIYGTTFKIDNEKIIGVDWLLKDTEKVNVIRNIMQNNNLNDCSSIIYLGDGITDLPAMEYVRNNGGVSLFVYLDEYKMDIDEIKKKGIVSEFFKADYSKGSDLYNYLVYNCQLKDE